MIKSKNKIVCHNCLESFYPKSIFRCEISKTNPHYILLCKKCEAKENRKISKSIKYKPFKNDFNKRK
jgi:hypothetical protein